MPNLTNVRMCRFDDNASPKGTHYWDKERLTLVPAHMVETGLLVHDDGSSEPTCEEWIDEELCPKHS